MAQCQSHVTAKTADINLRGQSSVLGNGGDGKYKTVMHVHGSP